MNRIRQFFRESLDLSLSEARSATVLFSLIFVTLVITYFTSLFLETRASEIVIKEFGDLQFPKKPEKKVFSQKDIERPVAIRYFPFDPNTASEAELKTLGIAASQVKMILNYRNKNGRFRFKEDLKRMYGFKPDTYAALESFISLPSKNDTEIRKSAPPITSGNKQSPEKTIYKTHQEISRFDLNTADTAQLKMLKGIGSVLASRIVKFRDMLGGFISAEQVTETYGVSPEAMTEIRKYTFIGSAHKKIKINSVSQDQFRHPYLKSYQAKAIITYRNQHGKFTGLSDLKAIHNLDEGVIEKLGPYLEFE